jgi:hypothetical protein
MRSNGDGKEAAHTPRRRYDSDDRWNDARRSWPHVRIHHSIKNHPKTVALMADAEMRGMLLGLWLIASERRAAHADDWVHLSRDDVAWVTGKRRHDMALRALQHLAAVMGYECQQSEQSRRDIGATSARHRRDVWSIRVRNFAKKQGLAPPTPRKNSASSHLSLARVASGEDRSDTSVAAASPQAALQLVGADASPEAITPEEIVGAWQDICVPRGAPGVKEVTRARREKLRKRIHEHPSFDWWQDVFRRMAASTFLFGNGRQGWRATLDWLIANETNAVRILEGTYAE